MTMPNAPQQTAPPPPNPELAALPNLYLFNPKNRAFIDGVSPYIYREGRITQVLVSPDHPSVRGKSPPKNRSVPLLLTLFIALMAFITWQWFLYAQLITSGVITEGTITGRSQNCEGCSYSVTYRFVADDHLYTAQVSVRAPTFESVSEGSNVEVIYAPSNPTNSALVGEADLSIMGNQLPIIYIIAFLLMWLLLVEYREQKRAQRLARGTLLRGKVMSWRMLKQIDSEGDSYVECSLQFKFPTSTEYPRYGEISRNIHPRRVNSIVPAQVGMPVAVMYVDDKLYQVL